MKKKKESKLRWRKLAREGGLSPEQDKDGIWFILLPSGERKVFRTNAEAWRWLDRHERREVLGREQRTVARAADIRFAEEGRERGGAVEPIGLFRRLDQADFLAILG